MSHRIMITVPDHSYHHLKEMSTLYQVSLSALAGSMIEEKLSGKESFEEEVKELFGNITRRLGKMAYKLSRTELLTDEFLHAYLFYTPEVPKDFAGREALHQSATTRHKALLSSVQERLKNKEDLMPE